MSNMSGTPITMENGSLNVPNDPVVYYIEGDGIGVDITPVMIKVVDAAVDKAYGGSKRIHWVETLAGEKAFNQTGEWLPKETLDSMQNGLVSIKGPLTTPVGGGIRSLNVALRQELDLFACVRPVRWYEGTPSPVKSPQDVDMIIFRENSEDVYAGIEWESGSEGVKKVIDFLVNEESESYFLEKCFTFNSSSQEAIVYEHEWSHSLTSYYEYVVKDKINNKVFLLILTYE